MITNIKGVEQLSSQAKHILSLSCDSQEHNVVVGMADLAEALNEGFTYVDIQNLVQELMPLNCNLKPESDTPVYTRVFDSIQLRGDGLLLVFNIELFAEEKTAEAI